MQIETGKDKRIVLTLDAGGTALKFSAIHGNKLLESPSSVSWAGDDLDQCLANIVDGFESVKRLLPEAPVALNFAFPGPADYPAGIVTNVGTSPPSP